MSTVAADREGQDESAGKESSRLRILTAAAEIAAECGYEGTTISKVTKRSGLPASSIYWFFKDKDELLAEVVRHSFEEWIAGQPVWNPIESGTSAGDALRAILSSSVESLPAAPDFLRIGHLLALETRAVEPAAREIFVKIRVEVEDVITAWFRGALGARKARRKPTLARDLARIVIAGTDGLFVEFQIQGSWDPHEHIEVLAAIVDAAISAA